MSVLKVITQPTVLRISQESSGRSVLVAKSVGETTLQVSRVGLQGGDGPEGPAGKDGAAQLPAILDGGNF
jgi:hypothetical protein